MTSADRRAVAENSTDLRHHAEGLRRRAAATRAEARALIDRLACRSRSSPFCRPLLIRGGSGAVQPEPEQASASLTCTICHREIRVGQSAVRLQTTPSHFDCVHATQLRVPATSGGVIRTEIAGVFDEPGQRLVAWNQRCRVCGSTWRTDLVSLW